MGSQPKLLVDLDDTLVPNFACYNIAKIEVLRYLIQRLQWKAPSPTEFIEFEERIDAAKVASMGYRPERFISSQDEAAKHFFELADVYYTDADSQIVRERGAIAFSTQLYAELGPIPGAFDAIRYARAKGAHLHLVTKGAEEVQWPKIKAFGVDTLFTEDQITILEEKTGQSLESIANGWDKARTWKIGNMIKSDVMPALSIGIGAVYVSRETWLHETRDTPKIPENARVITLKRLAELPTVYDQL